MKNPTKQAFTLVELIVVITILAILGTIAFISLQGYSRDSRDGARIADVNSVQKSLELYITEKGTYPVPDYSANITYSGGIAWIEGTIGDGVIRNLDKINKKLLDPLTGNEYTYSITSSKTEYQIGAISEGGTIGYKLPINQTHAATDKKATAMIRGTYNERFLKVQSGTINRILALPSIIATDITKTDVQTILDNSKLVYNNYQNIPHSYNNAGYTMTGGFNYTNPNPQIYSGSLKSLTESNTGKLDFITNLKTAYNGTILHGEANYQDIVNINPTTNSTGSIYLVNNLINTNVGGIKVSNIILPTSGTIQEEPEAPQTYTCTGELEIANADITNTGGLTVDTIYQDDNSSNSCYYTCKANYSGIDCETFTEPDLFLSNCTGNLQFIYTDATGTEIGRVNNAGTTISGNPLSLTCAGHIVVCSGTNSGYTLQACNLGSSTVGATNNSSAYGNRYQFGRSNNDWTNGNTSYDYDWKSPGGTNSGSANDWGVLEANKTTATWLNSDTTSRTKMQGPCPTNYHVPTKSEWLAIHTIGGWLSYGTTLSNTLKLPMAGRRLYDNGTMASQGTYGYYWSSSPNITNGYYLTFHSTSISSYEYYFRASGFSVRCIKN